MQAFMNQKSRSGDKIIPSITTVEEAKPYFLEFLEQNVNDSIFGDSFDNWLGYDKGMHAVIEFDPNAKFPAIKFGDLARAVSDQYDIEHVKGDEYYVTKK